MVAMSEELTYLMLGIYPWNYSSLSDTVRSMVATMPSDRLIYLNPQAETRTLALRWQERVDGDTRVWNPPFNFLPSRYGIHRLREKMSSKLLQSDLSRRLGSDWRERSVLYVTASTLEQSYDLVQELNPEHLIFDVLDDNLGFPNLTDAKRERLTQMFLEIARRSKRLTAVSQYLVDQTANLTNKPVEYLPNGVDVDRFRTLPCGDEPEDICHIPHPRLTFVGAITSWIDVRLLERVARTLPDAHLVMVGPLFEDQADMASLQNMRELPNVHFLGAKAYDEVPRYLHASDVLLLPRTYDPHSLACDPLKVYEYLATGKPTVSTAHPSVERFSEFIGIGYDDDGFIESIRHALGRNLETAQKQQSIIDSLSWKVRVDRLLQFS